MSAYLVLEDGTVFEGRPLGKSGSVAGEVVFNTGMTGYQEVLTDPSYAGQIVVMTYPLIGNYGLNRDDFESNRVQVAGFVVLEDCDTPSNWRARSALHDFLAEHGVVALSGIDTRAVTLKIREHGALMGMISDRPNAIDALQSAPRYDDQDFVYQVTTSKPYGWGRYGYETEPGDGKGYKARAVVLDCGLKWNILRRLAGLGVHSTVVPATMSAEEILGMNPDGAFLSPGPGDPDRLDDVVSTVRDLIGKLPMAGICLGHQMICKALGAQTYKLKFGHRGSNHPVKDLKSGRIAITSQNHGYAVDADSLKGTGLELTHVQLNDGTVEGVESEELNLITLQYHPEAAPGPWDSRPFFERFVQSMDKSKQESQV